MPTYKGKKVVPEKKIPLPIYSICQLIERPELAPIFKTDIIQSLRLDVV